MTYHSTQFSLFPTLVMVTARSSEMSKK